jgi:hypothetical protein
MRIFILWVAKRRLSIHVISHRVVRRLTNAELKSNCKEAAAGLIEVLARHLPGGTEEKHKEPARTACIPVDIRTKHLQTYREYLDLKRKIARPSWQHTHIVRQSLVSDFYRDSLLLQNLVLREGTVWIYCHNFTSFFVATFIWHHHPKSNISNVEPNKLRKLRWVDHVTRMTDTQTHMHSRTV